MIALLLLLAQDWPQWLGPTRDGVSTERVAPWKDTPAALWKVEVGEGHSSPIVAGGRVYLHAKIKGKDEETVAAYDVATGKELWSKTYPRAAFQSPFGLGPRATPIVSGGKLFTFGVTGLLTAWDVEGKQLWQVDTLKEFGAKNLTFGVSCSPLVVDGLLFLNVGGKGASVVAFAVDSGKKVWSSLDDKASYSSPVVLSGQLVAQTQAGVVGMSTSDGTPLWSFPLVDKLSESSITPILAGGLVIASSVTYGSAGIKVEGKTATAAWKNPALTCYISTPMPVGPEHVYMVTGTILGPPTATLRCVEAATGKILWSRPNVGTYHASLTKTADGKLLMLDDKGGLALLEPDPAAYKELASAKICGGTWAHPALTGGSLYVRDQSSLICVKLAP
ncbi:MAG TPA: PQQ-binding-like beta-propeller repeat protein [Planctomycetota bacterium]